MIKKMKSIFPYTIPIMVGYIFLGIAFGMLLEQAGFHFGWAILLSIVIYSGALQFICITFLSGGTNLLSIFFIAMIMNFRHSFYGISMLKKYRNTGIKKPYLIYSLTDETFSLLSTVEPIEGIDKGSFYFFVSLFNQLYWITGAVIGSLLSNFMQINIQGIEFAMTALFVVLFIEQMLTHKTYVIGFLGIFLSFLALVCVGQQYFIVLALLAIVTSILLMRKFGGNYGK